MDIVESDFLYKDSYEALVAAFTKEEYLEEIKKAKKEFLKIIGEVQPGEELYEIFMNFFLNWYILDRKLSTKIQTPIQIFLDQVPHGSNGKVMYFHLNNTNLSLFEFLKNTKESSILVRDIFTDEKYRVFEPLGNHGFIKKGLFEARLVPTEHEYFVFFNDFIFHPEIAYKFIKTKVKKGIEKHILDKNTLMKQLMYLRLKLSRYQNIDAQTIYSDVTYNKAFGQEL